MYDSGVLSFAAISAYAIYRMKSVDDVKAAASAVRLQIKDIERKISHLKRFCIGPDFTINESDMFNSSLIYEVNQWGVYHHKLFSHLSTDEYEMISNFYEDAAVIRRLQNDVKQFCLFYLQNKSVNYYNASFSVLKDDASIEHYQTAINDIGAKFDGVRVASYIPKHYGLYLSKYLDEYKPLVGTTAFQKLEKLVNKKPFIIF